MSARPIPENETHPEKITRLLYHTLKNPKKFLENYTKVWERYTAQEAQLRGCDE